MLLLLMAIGGWAHGASFEYLVMPGEVSRAHEEIEPQCESCHAPFQRSTQTQLCIDCHDEIREDLANDSGLHGQLPGVAGGACRDCHTEHEGRGADITGLVAETFEHRWTDFALTGAHEVLGCRACHEAGASRRDAPIACAGCHADDDAHRGGLGEECASCHRSTSWRDVAFDHEVETGFALVGEHAEQSCENCHIDQRYRDVSTTCVGCHRLDDAHTGSRGDDCGACHSASGWLDSHFDHAKATGFPLEGRHAETSCEACHVDPMLLSSPPKTCVGCHSSDDVHLGERGSDCGACHEVTSWQSDFDHARDAGFALRGTHAELACADCHGADVMAPLERGCTDCHQTDDPHDGSLGGCGECHGEESWTKQVRFDHELTAFPLVGMHRIATCEQCHGSRVFAEAPAACAECHAEDDVHGDSLRDTCGDCHDAGGWGSWRFDHGAETDFPLQGAHQDLVCTGCHGTVDEARPSPSAECVSCHQADDPHQLQFGPRCDRCHSTTSFSDEVRVQ